MLLPSFLHFSNETSQSNTPVEDPPSYSPVHAHPPQESQTAEEPITATTTPQASWSRTQCIIWLATFLIEKCELPRKKAEKVAGKFKECGVVMFSMERWEWEKLVGSGGRSVWARIQEAKRESAGIKTGHGALHSMNLARQHGVGVEGVGFGGDSQAEEKQFNTSLTVTQRIKLLEDEKKELEAGMAEENWQRDLASHERNKARNSWMSAPYGRECRRLEKIYDEKKNIAQEWDTSSERRRLRIQRIDLDIKALRKSR